MKDISTALTTHYGQGTTTLATCFKATLRNGTVIAATSLDRDLIIDGITYKATQSYNASDIDSSAELNTDNLEVAGVLSSSDITAADIHAGLWDHAEVEIFEVDYENLGAGKNILRAGHIGNIRTGRTQFFAELRGMMQAYTATQCELRGPSCRATLGDTRCKIDMATRTFTGVAGTVSADNRTIAIGLNNEAGYFKYGKITFLSGSNIGLSMEIKSHSLGSITLQLPMPYPVLTGDAFDIEAGCDKTLGTCRDRFNNVVNFRGEPWLPGVDQVMQIGGRKSLNSVAVVDPTDPPGDGGETPGGGTGGGGTGGGGGGGVDVISGTIDWYGNSIIAGWDWTKNGTADEGAIVETTTPEAFNAAAPVTTGTNYGVHGLQVEDALNGTNGAPWPDWNTHITSTSSTYIIVQLRSKDNATLLVTRLTTLINQAKAAGKTVFVFTDIPSLNDGTLTHTQIAAAQREAATATDVQVIDVHQYMTDYMAENGLSLTDVFPDTQHPTQEIYILIGQWVKTRLSQLLGTNTGSIMYGPDASLFGSSTTFFDDFDGTTLSNRWNRGLWYKPGVPPNTMRVNGGCLEMCTQPETMHTGRNETGYCVVDTDPDSSVGSNGFAQKYGVFQAECKLPVGRGYWPSFWLFGHPGVHRPEIDVFEAYPGGAGNWSDGSTAPHPMRADVTLHPLDDPGGYQAPVVNFAISDDIDLSADFHTYTVEWDEDYMKFYFDGQLVSTVTNAATLAWFSQFDLYFLLGFGINYDTAGGPSTNPAVSPTGFGSDPSNVPDNVFRVRYAAAWQFKKYGG